MVLPNHHYRKFVKVWDFKKVDSLLSQAKSSNPHKGFATGLLFKPFSRANTSKQHPGREMGLGLFITKELCSHIGGEIKVKSQLGAGKTFLFKVALEYVSD